MFFEPAKVLYCVLAAETLINLAYYKDVVFGATVVVEFAGILNNSYNLNMSTPEYLQEKILPWIFSMLTIVGVLELSTLLFNFRSAFYIKAR